MASATTAGAGAAPPGIYHKAGSLRSERRWALVSAYASLILGAVILLTPPIYMLITSLKTSAEIADQRGNPWLVRSPTLDNYWQLISDPLFQGLFFNSVIVTLLVVALTMVISILAARAASRSTRRSAGSSAS